MSSPCKSSGSLSTDGNPYTSAGQLCYAEATGGDLTCYNCSTSGELLCTVVSSGTQTFNNPVQFGPDGLHVKLTAGSAVVHVI